jgi:hypothetical protein
VILTRTGVPGRKNRHGGGVGLGARFWNSWGRGGGVEMVRAWGGVLALLGIQEDWGVVGGWGLGRVFRTHGLLRRSVDFSQQGRRSGVGEVVRAPGVILTPTGILGERIGSREGVMVWGAVFELLGKRRW